MKIIRIDDSRAKSLVNNKALWTDFPYFKTIYTSLNTEIKNAKCGVCKKREKRISDNMLYNNVRKSIVALSPALRAKLKRVLNAEFIRVDFTDDVGRSNTVTF